MPVDLAFVRHHFPGLASPWVFMDNAGGSHVLTEAADRVRDFLLTTPIQHGASYALSAEASAKVQDATAALAAMINARHPSEVVIGPSTTFLFQQLARAMASSLRPGDEIIVTDVDHESNIGPWRTLEGQGVAVREWQVNRETLELDLAALERLLNPRTRLVCVTHCSNILGTLLPIPAIAQLVHAAGAELCVDGVAYAPHRRVDVQALGCDWYAYSFYKTYGPHQAVLWGRRERLLELDSLNHWFIGKDRVPYKLQPGNVNYELVWGCAAIPAYFEALARHHGTDAFDAIAAHEEALAERVLAWLGARNDVRIIGRRSAGRAERVPTISFVADGRRSSTIVEAVDRHQVGIRFGDFYARRLIDHLGLADRHGVVRISMVHYNTPAEVDRLLAGLDEALRPGS
jgi:cysteine desulfurase family protein (TIGR01976 family)